MGLGRGHTLGLGELGLRGVRGSDSGFDGDRSRIREGLGSVSGRIGFVLVGVDLVVAKILSGPRHQVGLGIRGEELGILEEVLVVSVKKIMSVHGVRSSGFDGCIGVP